MENFNSVEKKLLDLSLDLSIYYNLKKDSKDVSEIEQLEEIYLFKKDEFLLEYEKYSIEKEYLKESKIKLELFLFFETSNL